MGEPVLIAFIGFLGALVAGFFKLISQQNKTHARLASAIDKMAKSSDKVAKETKRSADEAKQRNGHLGEQNKQIAQLIMDHQDDVVKMTDNAVQKVVSAVQNVNEQHVHNQKVDKATVKDETVQHKK